MECVRCRLLLMISLLAVVTVIGPGRQLKAADLVRTILLSGMPATGLKSGVTISSSGVPVINSSGETVFSTTVEGPSVDSDNDSVLYFSHRDSSLGVVAREGELADGLDGARWGRLSGVFSFYYGGSALNKSGQFAFAADLTGPNVDPTNDEVLMRASRDMSLTVLAREGDPVPGLPPGTEFGDSFAAPSLNNRGEVATRFILRAASSGLVRSAVATVDGGRSFDIVSQSGAEAPGIEGAVHWRSFAGATSLTDSGRTGFFGYLDLQDHGVTLNSDVTLYVSESNRSPRLVVREGHPVSDLDAEVTFHRPHDLRLNDSGETAFSTYLDGPGVSRANDLALFRASPSGEHSLIAREGDSAPGFDGDVVITSPEHPVINQTGAIAFSSRVWGPNIDYTNDDAVFIEEDGSVQLIVKEGDLIHEGSPSFYFGFPKPTSDSAVLNAEGQLAFSGFVKPSPRSGTYYESILAHDKNGELRIVARVGGLLNVSDNPMQPDMREIEDLSFTVDSGNQDGRSTGFNDAGQLAFSAAFTDGTTGVFVSSAPTVPEPAALSIVAALGLSVPLVRVRSR